MTIQEEKRKCSDLNGIECLCPLEGIIYTISKKWTLQIVALLGNNKKMRYNEILHNLKGISPKSLADRLKELKESELISRIMYSEIPPRVEYSLTRDGVDLLEVIKPLMRWSALRSGCGN